MNSIQTLKIVKHIVKEFNRLEDSTLKMNHYMDSAGNTHPIECLTMEAYLGPMRVGHVSVLRNGTFINSIYKDLKVQRLASEYCRDSGLRDWHEVLT